MMSQRRQQDIKYFISPQTVYECITSTSHYRKSVQDATMKHIGGDMENIKAFSVICI